jgi:transketolase
MDRRKAYEKAYPDLARQWKEWMNKELPTGWDRDVPSFPANSKGMATREASGKVLNSIAPKLGNLIGGSADLAPSTKTLMKGETDFQGGQYAGRNLRFGVREHGMGAILSGMALHGGVIPYGATFLIFSDYMRPPIRLAAIMGLKVVYIFTHDSVGVGEDGPTHQPVEQLSALRAIPNFTVIRPCDANETAEAWRFAIEHGKGPVSICLTRQGVPTLDRGAFASAEKLRRGGYVLTDSKGGEKPNIILIASGSEVHIAVEAAEKLEKKGVSVRVVSMPSWELFERQPEEYREQVLPSSVSARVAVEAGVPQGWHRYVGNKGKIIGVDHFGASAPYKTVYEKFGITADRVVESALRLSDGL